MMHELINDYKTAVKTFTCETPSATPSALAVALKGIVSAEGVDVYSDPSKLAAQLQSKGIEACQIKQVELAVWASAFVRYLDQLSSGLSAIDINNIILSVEEAGLSASVSRNVVSDILFSLNVPQIAQEVSLKPGEADPELAQLYIPPREYSAALEEIKRCVFNGQKLTEKQFSTLNSFLGARIPDAYTVMGMVYYTGLEVTQSDEKALEHWQYAASHGSAEAYGLLGDYYYNRDNMQAYRLYSRPGALALNEKRWDKFRNLLKTKKFHLKQLVILAALFVLTTVFMFVFKNSAITGGHTAAAIVCTIINALILAGSVFIHIKDPYQDLRHFSLPMMLMFLIFALILI